MSEFDPDEIDKKLDEAEKEMIKSGRCYDGLGRELDKLDKTNGEDHEGRVLYPKDDLTFRRVLKEIRDIDNEE